MDTLACPSHSCTFPKSAPRSRALVAAVARRGVRAEAFSIDPRRLGVFAQDLVVNGPVGERPVRPPLPRRVLQRAEERPVRVLAVAGGLEVVVDALQVLNAKLSATESPTLFATVQNTRDINSCAMQTSIRGSLGTLVL